MDNRDGETLTEVGAVWTGGEDSNNMIMWDYNKGYADPRWRAKRKAILRRDKYKCQDCKRRFGRSTEATVVHHIKPVEDYPELGYVNDNLISLCDKCHNIRHPEKGGSHQYPPHLRVLRGCFQSLGRVGILWSARVTARAVTEAKYDKRAKNNK